MAAHSVILSFTKIDTAPPSSLIVTSMGLFQRFHIAASSKPQLLEEVRFQLIKFPGTEMSVEDDLTLSHANFCSKTSLFGVILNDGRSALLGMNGATLQTLTGIWLKPPLEQTKATKIAINPTFRIIAVGYQSGNVEIFEGEKNWEHDRTFSLKQWGIRSEDTGPVSGLAWSPDGRVLSVGHEHRGFSLWSIYGCRIHCSLPHLDLIKIHQQEDHHLTPTKRGKGSYEVENEKKTPELLRRGLSCVAWGNLGYHLIVCENGATNFTRLSFVKNTLGTNPNQVRSFPYFDLTPKNYCHDIILQGPEELHILKKRGIYGEFKWRQLRVPVDYIACAYPLKFISVSQDGNSIAAIGATGLAIYSIKASQWEIFPDPNEDMICNGICWVSDRVVVLFCFLKSKKVHEVVCFDVYSLSQHPMLWRSTVPNNRVPLFIDCNEAFVLLFTTDGFLYQYKISRDPLSLVLSQQIMLNQPHISPVARSVLSSNISITTEPLEPKQVYTLSLFPNLGQLALCNSEHKQPILLDNFVESFWLARTEIQELGECTMCAYGKNGLKISFPFFSNQPATIEEPTRWDKSFAFDPDVYPIGFIPEWAVIIGLSQRITYDEATELPYFELHAQARPFLHTIIRNLLDQDRVKDATQAGLKYQAFPYFDISLELLLHETLQAALYEQKIKSNGQASAQSTPQKNAISPSKKKIPGSAKLQRSSMTPERSYQTADTLETRIKTLGIQSTIATTCKAENLKRVIEFLKSYPQYPSVMVRCARKMDSAVWDLLFFHADSPNTLFQHSIANKDLSTAASFLKIITEIHGQEDSKRAAFYVLELVLQGEDMSLLADLVRFLQQTVDKPGPVSGDVLFDESFYSPENLPQYARRLLQQAKRT